MTLLQRLLRGIHDGPIDACCLWTGATSLSRTTRYGYIQEGGRGSKIWRVHRLVLLIHTGDAVVPQEPDESWLAWVRRVDAYYTVRRLEASHTCDVSLCCNPDHLRWETRVENECGQIARRRAARRDVQDAEAV